MKLSDTAVRNAKPNPQKTRKLFDGGEMYLQIPPSSKKRWRFKYRFAGRKKCISFGVYPHVSLKYAREQRDKARELLVKGIDPSKQRKQAQIDESYGAVSNQITFEAVAWR